MKGNTEDKIISIQGVSITKLTFAKSLSIWIYGFLLLLITVVFQSLVNAIDLELSLRLMFIIVSYGFYYYIISSVATYFSATLKNNTSALSSILAIWIMWTIFLPKIWEIL